MWSRHKFTGVDRSRTLQVMRQASQGRSVGIQRLIQAELQAEQRKQGHQRQGERTPFKAKQTGLTRSKRRWMSELMGVSWYSKEWIRVTGDGRRVVPYRPRPGPKAAAKARLWAAKAHRNPGPSLEPPNWSGPARLTAWAGAFVYKFFVMNLGPVRPGSARPVRARLGPARGFEPEPRMAEVSDSNQVILDAWARALGAWWNRPLVVVRRKYERAAGQSRPWRKRVRYNGTSREHSFTETNERVGRTLALRSLGNGGGLAAGDVAVEANKKQTQGKVLDASLLWRSWSGGAAAKSI
ncbi:hypothetical protein DFP72DRAFT_861715 [Ephemerocybe angulata]|uniref:Uncharacterized protein n=1 Tax=Ephemerocybe angulata TaxID=980116 RepID=A0A8H6H9E4_9AGAR|nr:hypothetical protein DFP72DRAFT_861715 [Tulosesus angulatus]